MGGFEKKPGNSSLVQTIDQPRASPSPAGRTLIEQLPLKPAEQGGASAARAAGAPPTEERGVARPTAARSILDLFGPRMGHSFDDVNVHTDREGQAKAQGHGGVAVAEGRNIYLGQNVDPSSSQGHRVIAHEMAHVVQQSGGAAPQPRAYSRDGDALEHEAHRVGDIVAAGGSATPALRTGKMPQGYGSPEHQSMGNEVHTVLDPVAAATEDPVSKTSREPVLGGISAEEMGEQQQNQFNAPAGATHSPGLANPSQAAAGVVAVPGLSQMLKEDAFLRDRARTLTVSLRSFKMSSDAAGPFLAIETDPATKQAARYDVPVSPGDLTALNGDLYSSMENLRKAPVSEFVKLQGILDAEAAWEHQVAAGAADPKKEPNFDSQWESATAWRAHPVYGAGADLGTEASATGGDQSSYIGLAMRNEAHFGQDTAEAGQIDVQVRTGNVEAMAQGPQGNFATGNEQAWMDGHARALVLAREAHALKDMTGAPATDGQKHAASDNYGHESEVPVTGLVDPALGNATVGPALGNATVGPAPTDGNKEPLNRTSTAITYDSKLNDAYTENAGADHYLTDAFAAGHQIVRSVIGRVLDDFVRDKGGQDKFLDLIVKHIQEGAVHDSEHAQGDLGDFQDASHTWKDKAARGNSWLNSEYNPGRYIRIRGTTIGGDGLKQQLQKKIDDVKMHGIGAKVVHDYYNRRGMVVHNKKGMQFVIKGDGHSAEAPEARQIIAMAVLESRRQIAETAASGAMPNPLDVWDYTPSLDKTTFTETSGRKVMEAMFSDGDYLWSLIKDNFSTGEAKSNKKVEQGASAGNPIEKQVRDTRTPADFGQKPMQSWLTRRHAYISKAMGTTPQGPANNADAKNGSR